MSGQNEHIAQEIRSLLTGLSPLIERHTAAVCPSCTEVCCRQDHGTHRGPDLAYLAALGMDPPERDAARADTDPCQFLGARGCTRERWQRAWKCTWFFCDPLLSSIGELPPREARELSRMMERITELRGRLIANKV